MGIVVGSTPSSLFVCMFVGSLSAHLHIAHLHNACSYSPGISEYLIFENTYALIYIFLIIRIHKNYYNEN